MSYLVILIISLAFLGEAVFGFGGGLISIPLLSLFLGVKDSVTLVLIFQFLMGILIFKTFKQTNWKVALPMSFGLIAGTILGTWMLSFIDESMLRKILSFSILIFLIKIVFLKGFKFGQDKSWGFLAGALGGLLQGLIGTGGPIFTMYLAALSLEKVSFRATLIYLFFVTSIIRIFVSYYQELFTSNLIYLALPTIPFFLLAIFLGQKLHRIVSEKFYQYTVYLILLFAAVSLLLK